MDACGGHWGYTPDSPDTMVYHYHVQSAAPFTIGCFGPNTDGSLVTVEQCRELYSECGDGDEMTVTTPDGSFEYDPWCPCYDANGSNVGTEELAVFSATEASAMDSTADEALSEGDASSAVVDNDVQTETSETTDSSNSHGDSSSNRSGSSSGRGGSSSGRGGRPGQQGPGRVGRSGPLGKH